MKKPLVIIGIIVVVLLVIVIALPFIINVNRFKPELETKLSDALGRKVEIGNIGLSILSGGVNVDNLVVADDPAFSHSPFLQAKELKAGVALLPLIFSGKLEVARSPSPSRIFQFCARLRANGISRALAREGRRKAARRVRRHPPISRLRS